MPTPEPSPLSAGSGSTGRHPADRRNTPSGAESLTEARERYAAYLAESAGPDSVAQGTVTARLVHRDNDLVDLTIRGRGGKIFALHTTSSHLFWDETAHSWVPAGSLTPGHALNTSRDRHVPLVSVRARAAAADMYNLTVEQLHTY
ncbi:polymorphic toxin-type HINT domain-containing protein [Streptomyces sp. NPDC127077]|uniref:polymorphic toxin-type HINT domain-containing protein n=1 Tax=Streptomyces sp. NPDC127077 TaxID=3347131 RepID=UPI00364F0A32